MKPIFRYVETKEGWIVEYGFYSGWWMFKKLKWKAYVETSGIEEAWIHSEHKYAKMNLQKEAHFSAYMNSDLMTRQKIRLIKIN